MRVLLPALIIAVCAGCSRIGIAYRQLDWVMPLYLESYMELSDTQDSYLRKRLDDLLAWHCHSQLPDYALLLRQAGTAFQNSRISRADIEIYHHRIGQLWKTILHRSSPTIAGILENASPAQLDELFSGLEQRNREWLAEFQGRTENEIRMDYEERMGDELKRWVGPLTDSQQQAVVDWSMSFRPLGLDGLAARKRWQSNLRRRLALRDNPSMFYPAIDELLVHPETLHTPHYRKLLEHNRELTIDLVYRIAKSLSAAQRRHLGSRAASIAGDIEALVCDVREQQARDTLEPERS